MSPFRFVPSNVYLSLRRFAGKCAADEFRLAEFSKKFLGGREISFTKQLTIVDPKKLKTIPIYRVLDEKGRVIQKEKDVLEKETALRIYRTMNTLAVLDKVMIDIHRQGRIGFYMAHTGEECNTVASAAALQPQDVIYAQYREFGALLWRDYSMQQFVHQCFGNVHDWTKGREMAVHYGSSEKNFVTISGPLATQMPQAVGSAYAFKQQPKSDRISFVYFGEGAASEGDAHAAMNFATTLKCPLVFFCRNNGYAISTGAREQYAGDGVAARAVGYGLRTLRIDGNDVLAVHEAVREARKTALRNEPVFIEAMTYRLGDHSTSDDSSSYRTKEEISLWKGAAHPTKRYQKFLQSKGWLDEDAEMEFVRKARSDILAYIRCAESENLPHYEEMFGDVWSSRTRRLDAQLAELERHLDEYGQHYPLDKFKI